MNIIQLLFLQPMDDKTDVIIFGAERAEVTWLHFLRAPAELDAIRSSANRLGMRSIGFEYEATTKFRMRKNE